MIIVNPTVTDHFIKVVPRFYPTTEVTFNISDSLNNTNDTVTAIYLRDKDDKLKLTFTYTFKDTPVKANCPIITLLNVFAGSIIIFF